MAAIRDFAVTEYGTATAASLVCEMPVHESGDILIYFASKDGSPVIDATATWNAIQDGVIGALAAYRSMWKLAASSSETLTLTTVTAENWTVVVVSIKNANTGAPISASAESAADDSAMPFDGPSTNTGTDINCLIFHAWFADTGLSPTAYAPLVNIYAGDNGANSTGVAYTYQRTAGAVAAGSWFGRANIAGRGIVVAVKDNGSETEIPPYSDPVISSGQVLRPLVGLSTTFSDTWPTSVTITALGSNFEANSVYIYEVAPSWTDKTTDANDPGAADITWPIHIGDMMYFGASAKFGSLSFITSTAGVTGVVAWEYWNGAWVTAPGMAGAFTATGGAKVAFTSEGPPAAWVTNDPGMGQTKYWVRCRITTAYTVAAIQSQIRLNGYVATYIVATASADSGTNPYTDSTQSAGSSSQLNLAGPQINFGAALDISSGIIMGTVLGVLPSDFAKDIALPSKAPGGVQITFFDTNNACLSYKLGAMGCKSLDVDGRNVWAIDWNGSATPWAICNSISKSAVTRVHLTTLGYFAAAAHRWSMLSRVTRIGIAGGTSGVPLDLDDIVYAANRCIGMFPFLRKSGSAVTSYAPLQFGGGDPVKIECNLNTFQFPHIYDGVDYFDWNAAVDIAGIKFYPQSGDALEFTNCVFTSESSYRWEFDPSSASSGWTGDFSGTSVVGANVTLRAVFVFNLMSFINCSAFAQNSAVITNCNFNNTKVSSATLDDMALISDCTFTSSGTGHAIEVGGSADTISLSGNTFTGYSGTGTNAAIYVNIVSGTVTINVTGGNTPSIRTAGATVIVNNNVEVTFTGMKDNSEVRVYDSGTGEQIAGIEDATDGTPNNRSFTWSDAVSNVVDYVIHSVSYETIRVNGSTVPGSATSIPIQQRLDRNYENPP